MTMKRFFLVPMALALIAGCNTADKDKYTRELKIRTIPSGAPIVVDSLRMGKTPLSINVETNEDGCFVRKTVITAIPHEASLQTQVVTFPAYKPSDSGKSVVPEMVRFDLTKSPSDPTAVYIGDDDE